MARALTSTQLNATANVSGSFSYNPSAGTVLGAGTTILQVTFAPRSSHYTSVTATTSVQVTPYTPVINWATPAPITSGTALSSAQLNATANVAGNFIYSPGPGTMPSVGTTTLQATFTPYDTTDYSTQTVTVQLVVTATKASTNVVILYPSAGATISGTINVLGYVNLFLDSAGTYLMVDGVDVSTYRVMGSPWLYKPRHHNPVQRIAYAAAMGSRYREQRDTLRARDRQRGKPEAQRGRLVLPRYFSIRANRLLVSSLAPQRRHSGKARISVVAFCGGYKLYCAAAIRAKLSTRESL